MEPVSGANGLDVEGMVQRAVDAKVGAVDVMLNQRVGPVEKYQAEILAEVKKLSNEIAGLRQDQVNLRGEIRRGRLARQRRRKRRTQ